MDKIRIYIALLFCLTLSFILPVHAQDTSGSNSNRYNTQYSYDCMGNITSLSRNGLLDDGSYGLILPSVIEFAGGKTIKYTYSADGHKLRAVYTTETPATTKQIDYCGNLIFENGQLQQINVDGGYATYIGSSWAYHFYVKDHLGNNRMVIHPSSLHQQPQVNNYYPYGGLMANSTNHNQQRYKYNGKELDRMHGLDWYDYGARWMDAAIGRWHVIDPLCEKYYDISPYAYCAGDPVNAIDPNGKSILTKVLKATMRIGSRVASNGLRELGKAATYADAVSDVKENANTVVDGNASTIDRIGAGVFLTSELLPVSVGDVKDVVKILKNVHGNSKLSTKAQHAYDIIDKRTDKVVKTGISGGKIRKDGKSYRAEQQVRKWNKEEDGYIYESEITHQEPAGAGARDKILKYEKDRATKLREELDHDKHQKP